MLCNYPIHAKNYYISSPIIGKMPNCEICGQDTDLLQAEIEGMEMSVCSKCTQFGQIKKRPQIKEQIAQRTFKKSTRSEPHLEMTETIVSDYAQKIRKAREKLGLKQEDFAKRINEKESLLHKMETGSFEPNISLAKKLQKLLNIKLIEKIEEKRLTPSKISSEGLTIGDLIKK